MYGRACALAIGLTQAATNSSTDGHGEESNVGGGNLSRLYPDMRPRLCRGCLLWQLISEQDEEEPEYYEFLPPKREMLGVDLVAMSATAGHICGLTKEGTVACDGSNTNGEQGVGSNESVVKGIARQKGLAGATSVTVRSSNTCATTERGVYCWGENYSNSLGLGPQMNQNLPRLLPSIQSVAINHSHSCGVTSEGLVSCWGASNGFHQLGCEKGSPNCGGMAILTSTSPRVEGLSDIASDRSAYQGILSIENRKS